MSQIKSPDQEAAELLPCLELIERGKPCSSTAPCYVCAVRPAVAERLRQRDEWITKLEKAGDPYGVLRERIAALEAENERLRAFRDSHMMNCDCGLCVSERAALAGRGK